MIVLRRMRASSASDAAGGVGIAGAIGFVVVAGITAVAAIGLAGCYASHELSSDTDGGGVSPVPDGCAPARETCNGTDDDCDGLVDEGDDADLGCETMLCEGGACVCPPERMCGGECVDISRDARHCGECDRACLSGLACVGGTCCTPDVGPVDMLFMVDNSNSMGEEQASLAEAFPRMMAVLTSGDVDGDGTPEFAPIDDLHVGVVTSDMGTGGFRVPTCTDPDFGDDGILRARGSRAIPGCAERYPTFLTFAPGVAPDAFSTDFACVAVVGTGGCGFEQQLESPLKALTPSTSDISFFRDTPGHRDGENSGFLRTGSVLAVIVVTDEDDCSVADPELFNPSSGIYEEDLNLRCFRHPEAIHPISRYVDGLLALRAQPRDLVFAQITGIPRDAVPDPGAPDYAAILAHPNMRERIDPTDATRLWPACNVPGRGRAYPPRRIVETARELDARGAGSVVASICQDDFTDAVVAIADRVGRTVYVSCE